MESAADRSDAGRHPFDGWQSHAEDDALGSAASLGEGRKDCVLDVQCEIGRLHNQAGKTRNQAPKFKAAPF